MDYFLGKFEESLLICKCENMQFNFRKVKEEPFNQHEGE